MLLGQFGTLLTAVPPPSLLEFRPFRALLEVWRAACESVALSVDNGRHCWRSEPSFLMIAEQKEPLQLSRGEALFVAPCTTAIRVGDVLAAAMREEQKFPPVRWRLDRLAHFRLFCLHFSGG